jgi:hypothetical protein
VVFQQCCAAEDPRIYIGVLLDDGKVRNYHDDTAKFILKECRPLEGESHRCQRLAHAGRHSQAEQLLRTIRSSKAVGEAPGTHVLHQPRSRLLAKDAEMFEEPLQLAAGIELLLLSSPFCRVQPVYIDQATEEHSGVEFDAALGVEIADAVACPRRASRSTGKSPQACSKICRVSSRRLRVSRSTPFSLPSTRSDLLINQTSVMAGDCPNDGKRTRVRLLCLDAEVGKHRPMNGMLALAAATRKHLLKTVGVFAVVV